jgi:DNA-binding IscR family transcriptional regulator
MCNYLHEEVLKLLIQHETSYAKPMNSEKIGEILKVTPSYIRRQLSQLAKIRLVGVRRGNGGGYYLVKEEMQQHARSE